jgi:predicted metalloendopeptidase
MIQNIKDEFKIMLKEYDWMDDMSRTEAIEKVKIVG